MIHSQSTKTVMMIAPQIVSNTAITGYATTDTLGYDYMTVSVFADTVAAASNNPATLTLSESQDTVATNHTNITAFVGDTAFTIPDGITATATLIPMAVMHVDLRKRERYIRCAVTQAGATNQMCVTGLLSRAREAPITAAGRGAGAVVIG